MPWYHGFVLGLPPRGGFWEQSEWPWDMIHSMPCRNPCRLYIHLAFTYSIGPSSVVWSELGPAPPFPPMRVLEVQWSRALSLVCEVALKPPKGRVENCFCFCLSGQPPLHVHSGVHDMLAFWITTRGWLNCNLNNLDFTNMPSVRSYPSLCARGGDVPQILRIPKLSKSMRLLF